jgi:hypothetical protein
MGGLAMSKEAMKLALDGKSLYDITGSITDIDKCIIHRFDLIQALAALTKQEQGEPFGWYDMEHGEIRDVEWNRLKPTYEGVWRPLYTTPQQRKPLTIEQMAKAFADAGLNPDIQNDELSVARAIEAAHGIKGEA